LKNKWGTKFTEFENVTAHNRSAKAWRVIKYVRRNKGANWVIKFVSIDQ